MKTNLILSLALGFFLGSCQNSGTQPEAKSGTSAKKLAAEISQPGSCTSYSVFNPHGPMGTTILFFYLDCNGDQQSGSVDPQESVNVLAQPGSIKCNDCVVTENGGNSKDGAAPSKTNTTTTQSNTDPAQTKP